MMSAELLSQITRFTGIGAIATLVHMGVALLCSSLFGFEPQPANFAGFCAAVGVSYLGHGRVTFYTNLKHRFHAPRFLTASVLALGLSSGLTQVITVKLGHPLAFAMIAMAVVVPLSSFFLYKFWVFSEPQRSGP